MKKEILFVALILATAFVIYAMAQPKINSVSDSPNPVEVPGYNNITADITNATQAYVEIYYPNSTLMGNYSMNNIPPSTWYFNQTYAYPDPLGNYSYVVKAYNASGWNTSSSYNFTLQDTTPPTSSVDTLSKYWYNTSIVITATANDNYHIANVTLWYRYSNDNATWGSWTYFGKDATPPYSWNFNFPNGEGYYEFYTIANDTAGNTEAAPSQADESAGYDATPPTSSVEAMPYVHTSLPLVINATASDSLSGIKSVSLWYRYSNDNATWGSWTFYGSDATSPYSWSFNAPSGDGYYEFYTIAEDNASNKESKTTADENACIDTTPPTTSIAASPSYQNHIKSSSSITLSASDNVCGVDATYYRIWNGTWNPSPGNGTGKDNDFYVYTSSFNLIKEGTNYVEYYSVDKAGNVEATHNQTYFVDDLPPVIDNVVANPENQTSGGNVNITCRVTDDTDLDGVYLEVYYPDGSFSNFTMYHIPCTTYYRNEVYTIVGMYNFTIFAKDKLGNACKTGVYHFNITTGNRPPNKPSKPSGPTAGVVGTSYTYSTSTTDPDGDAIYYLFDWGDGSNSSWVGPCVSGATAHASHIWGSPGSYNVRVKAKDTHGAESEWSDNLTVVISTPNSPPVTTCILDPPTPDGKNGWYLRSVNVTLTATDPDGDAIQYIKYRLDGGAWQNYTAPFEVAAEGSHTLEYYSADVKGNVEKAKTTIIKIDKSKPTIEFEKPLDGYLYIFNRQFMFIGNTVIIGGIVVRALAYDKQSDISNVSFYVDGRLQAIDTAYPYEWLWRGAIGYHYISMEAYNKAGLKDETSQMLVYIFSL